MIETLCCTCPPPSTGWIKSAMPVFAAILSFLLALLILPLIRARNEQKRLESLKTVVLSWLELISSKISYQITNLEELIKFLKDGKSSIGSPFLVVDVQIDHLLGYNDDDLRKVLFEKLDGNSGSELYVEIINDILFVKANQKHLEETYDKWRATVDGKKEYLPIFETSLKELKASKESIDKYILIGRNSSIKADWWIWS